MKFGADILLLFVALMIVVCLAFYTIETTLDYETEGVIVGANTTLSPTNCLLICQTETRESRYQMCLDYCKEVIEE